jgi:hypothetical protein
MSWRVAHGVSTSADPIMSVSAESSLMLRATRPSSSGRTVDSFTISANASSMFWRAAT